ncbi:putative sulfate exporter family transporter [Brevibacterium aurantiacum]|uniref:YeiH family protein n=1 Tax=Brevibacterium aurantiacum TaxID=273384 RepID=UPI000DF1F278|nr:putative sulfate exporter family transporter [Brevibacterium aurantiacum]AZL14055.1 putative sulfate exporter family transporter [Brevibacterium aurantiacum]RCS92948.1 putative sulfate exporter family transporter [Brevibacterium aurantiacum]
MKHIVRLLPGLGVAAAATAIAWPISLLAPVLSPLLIAIVLGIVVGNVFPELPPTFRPGLDFAAKPLLRLGIVALGAQVVLGDILELGWLVLVLAAVVVGVGIVSGLLLARPFRVESNLALLIGCGFGICGAAAVAGVESTLKAKKEDVAAAIGLVVLFGTLMIAVIPSLSIAFGLAPDTAGMWGGASTHEVAQVVAIGGIIGPAALQVAVLVKLSRVIMLAPTVAVLSMVMRRRESRAQTSVTSPAEVAPQSSSTAESASTAQSSSGESVSGGKPPAPATKRPPIVPLFVVGFLLMAGLRTFGLLPDFAVSGLGWLQTVCLAMAMFALGRGVQWRSLRNLGAGPIGLAATTTLIVAVIGLGGALLLT